MEQYKELLEKIMSEGENSGDRTGTGTRRIFGHYMSFDCSETFPLVTMKYTHFPAIAHELLWFIKGSTNIKYLQDNGITIWDEWANAVGEVGPMYGAQWRHRGGLHYATLDGLKVRAGTDQLQGAIDTIIEKPYSRRIIVDCWDVATLSDEDINPKQNVDAGLMALAPCHMMFQFFVSGRKELSMTVYQRSVDSFLGLPFNIASYALLLKMVAQVTFTVPKMLNWVGGDVHIYNNHIPQVKELLKRESLPLPTLELNPYCMNIDEFNYADIDLQKYHHQGRLAGAISV